MPNYANPNLWRGCVGAWCPSQDRSRSTILTDFSGFGNNGLLTNMEPATDWVASQGQMALDLDGVNDHLEFRSFNLASDLTWCIWFRTAFTANQQIGGQGDGQYTGMYFQTDGSSQIVAYADPAVIIGGLLESNKWTLLSLTKKGSSVSLYVNNAIVATGTTSPTDSTSPLSFGRVRYRFVEYYSTNPSSVDDVRVYNRALTQSEIATLALRRGIAYETTRSRSYFIPAAVDPPTAALTLNLFAPTIATPVTVAPATAALTLTQFAPTILVGDAKVVVPSTAALALTTFAPTVRLPVVITPALLELVLTPFNPTVINPVTLTPGTASLVLTGYRPSTAPLTDSLILQYYFHMLG